MTKVWIGEILQFIVKPCAGMQNKTDWCVSKGNWIIELQRTLSLLDKVVKIALIASLARSNRVRLVLPTLLPTHQTWRMTKVHSTTTTQSCSLKCEAVRMKKNSTSNFFQMPKFNPQWCNWLPVWGASATSDWSSMRPLTHTAALCSKQSMNTKSCLLKYQAVETKIFNPDGKGMQLIDFALQQVTHRKENNESMQGQQANPKQIVKRFHKSDTGNTTLAYPLIH